MHHQPTMTKRWKDLNKMSKLLWYCTNLSIISSGGMTAHGNFGVHTQNYKDNMLVGYTIINSLKIMNTFFDRKASKKWT